MNNKPTTAIEIINTDFRRGGYRAAIFDFDGTLSLLRRNWQDVMIPLMVETLAATGSGESSEQLNEIVEEFVMRLNGRQTIYQMIQLAAEVERRGGTPLEPLEYKHQYHDKLWSEVGRRVEQTRSGEVDASRMRVPGSVELLTALQQSGLTLYLASGTDLHYVRDEVEVLGLSSFFGDHIYGVLDDYEKFSKAMIIQQIVRESKIAGEQLLGFGDGFVEIEEVKKVGGLAIGVASNEETCEGINGWKRERLIHAGADIIIGDYRARDELLKLLGAT